MSIQNDERERLKRLRDRQLQARNPQKADQRVMHQVARRRGRRQKKVTLGEMLRDLPHKWRGLFFGCLLGVLLWLLLTLLVELAWVDLLGLAVILVLALLGYALGQAFDARDELRRL